MAEFITYAFEEGSVTFKNPKKLLRFVKDYVLILARGFYTSLLYLTLSIFTTPLSITTHFLMIFGYIITNNSSSISFNIMISYSSDCVFRYAPGISILDYYFPLCPYMAEVFVIAYRDTFVDTRTYFYVCPIFTPIGT